MSGFAGLTVAEALRDPALFGQHFPSPSWGVWRATLKACFGERLSLKERQLFRTVAGDRAPPSRRVSEAAFIKGRGGGGTSAASGIAAFLAITFDGQRQLRPGERAVIALVAFDRAQAKQLSRFTRGLFEETQVLAGMIESATDESIALTNRVTIEVLSNNYRSIRGRSLAGAVFDEAAFWRDENFANPDIEVHAAVTPGLGRVEGSMLVVVTSPYKRSGLAFDMWRESFGKDDPDRLVVLGGTRAFNQTFDQRTIDATLAKDFARFSAEYLAQWRDDVGSFLTWDLIERAAVLPPGGNQPEPGIRYFCAMDTSSGQRDAMTIAIAHRDKSGKVIVDYIYGRKAPFDPNVVAKECASIMHRWRIREATTDAHAKGWVISAFGLQGIKIVMAEFSKSDTFLEVEPLFAQDTIAIPRHTVLMTELRDLERRTHRGGKDTVDHPQNPNFHDDFANAMALAAQLAAQTKHQMIVTDKALQLMSRPYTGYGGPLPVSFRKYDR